MNGYAPAQESWCIYDTQHAIEQTSYAMQGAQEGYSKGRERSFHFGAKEHHICGMISHLGPQLAIADGVALAYKLRHENKVSIAFTGDGGTVKVIFMKH